MLVCGAWWTLFFPITQFQPQPYYPEWSEIIVIGVVSSILFGRMRGRDLRLAPGSHAAFINMRLGISFAALYSFFILWKLIFPLTPVQMTLLWITVVMLACIIAGVWLRETLAISLGVAVTLMSVLGYYLLPHYFWLWVAVFAGLPLIGAGIYFLRRR
jgi:hypothetical protein